MFQNLFKRNKNGNVASNGNYQNGNSHLIELRKVVKNYETAAGTFSALKGIDLDVGKKEFVAVVGKSGSGKSTLINMITGIDRPSSGDVLVGDTAVHTLNESQLARWRGRNMGVIFQFFQLLPTLTVLENVMLPMDFCNVYASKERVERAMHYLDQVEMTDHAHKLPSATSGGNSSEWQLPVPWLMTPLFWSLTNQPEIWIPKPPRPSSNSSLI